MFQISCSSNLNTIYNNNNSNEILTSIQNTNSTKKKNNSNFNFQYFKRRKKLNSMRSFRCLSTSASPKNKKNISNHSIYSNDNNSSNRINSIKSEEKINEEKIFKRKSNNNLNKISVKKNFFQKDKIMEKFSFVEEDGKKNRKQKLKTIIMLYSQNNFNKKNNNINYNNFNSNINSLCLSPRTERKNELSKEKKNKSNSNEKIHISPNEKNIKITKKMLLSLSPRRGKKDIFNLRKIVNNSSINLNMKNLPYSNLQIIFISNYGNKNKIGFDKIKLFTQKRTKEIPILKTILLNGQKENKKNSDFIFLFNNNLNNNNILKPTLEIYFSQFSYKIEEISILNFQGKDKTISLKEIEIIYQKKIIYKGILPLNQNCFISLLNNKSLKKNKNKITPNQLKRNRNEIQRIYVNRKKEKEELNIRQYKNNKIIQRINSLENMISYRENSINEELLFKSKSTLNINHSFKSIDLSENHLKRKINYILCDKIKIFFLSNHSNNYSFIFGLTSLQIYIINNKNKEELFNINKSKTVGAMPKDLNTQFNLKNDERIFENLFNNINNTINENNMWLTFYNKEDNFFPFIEITFKKSLKISKINFFNWNNPSNLERGIKTGKLYLFNKDKMKIKYNFYLFKGLGEYENNNENYFCQSLKAPFKEYKLSKKEIEPYKEENYNISHWSFGLLYNTPYLPFGYYLKFEFISNYGNNNFIGLNSINLYNQNGEKIINFKKCILPFNSIKKNSGNILLHYINLNKEDNNTFYNNNNYNRMYFFFENPIGISIINIENYCNKENNKYSSFIEHRDIGIREIKIFMENNIIYEGKLRKGKNNSILFTGNKEILKKINIIDLCLIGDEFDESFSL